MANILVSNANNRVISAVEDTVSFVVHDSGRWQAGQVIFPFQETEATKYEGVTIPSLDDYRYTYDGTTFVDQWPFDEITKVQFIDLLQDHGGVDDATLVASRQDTNLGAFWLKFELAEDIARDDGKTGAGMDALIATGYLTSTGKQAVLDNWPRTRPQ